MLRYTSRVSHVIRVTHTQGQTLATSVVKLRCGHVIKMDHDRRRTVYVGDVTFCEKCADDARNAKRHADRFYARASLVRNTQRSNRTSPKRKRGTDL